MHPLVHGHVKTTHTQTIFVKLCSKNVRLSWQACLNDSCSLTCKTTHRLPHQQHMNQALNVKTKNTNKLYI